MYQFDHFHIYVQYLYVPESQIRFESYFHEQIPTKIHDRNLLYVRVNYIIIKYRMSAVNFELFNKKKKSMKSLD